MSSVSYPSPRPSSPVPHLRAWLAGGLALTVGAMVVVGGATRVPPKADPTRPAVLQAISDCRRLTEDGPRLICYDKAAAALDDALSQGALTAFDRVQAKAVRRESFGFQLPTLDFFTKGPKEDVIEKLSLKVTDVSRTARGTWILTTSEGPVWVQTQTDTLYGEPHAGSQLEVSKGALGGFFCTVDKRDTFRCARQH